MDKEKNHYQWAREFGGNNITTCDFCQGWSFGLVTKVNTDDMNQIYEITYGVDCPYCAGTGKDYKLRLWPKVKYSPMV